MRRRDLIAVCGTALAGVAGCLSSGTDGDGGTTPESDTSTQTPTPTEDTTDDPTPTSDPTTSPDRADSAVSVGVHALQPGVIVLTNPDSAEVESGSNQYLFLDVEVVAGDSPPREAFRFRFDGDDHSPIEDVRELYHKVLSMDPYERSAGAGWLAFELPETGEASDAKLTWGNGEWRPEEAYRDRLANPLPELSVSSTIPETVPVGEAPSVTVTATNEGNRSTEFVGVLNRQGGGVAHAPVDYVSTPVMPGESITWEPDDSMPRSVPENKVGDGEPDMTYDLYYASGNREQSVRVVE